MIRAGREPLVLFGTGVVLLFLSGLHPFDRMTWALEVAPILIGVPVLFGTYRRFPLTPLVYRLIFLHAVVLMIGGHYTYERVPAGFWFRDVFHLSRNHYDRFGHLVQGFVPAIIAREVLLRVARLRRGALLFILVTSVCLSVSALYELFEWAMALLLGQGADAFLATQGDPWDTQEDMLMALIGAIVAQLALARVHDRQLEALRSQPVRTSRAA
jgi:putative membrane protein